MNGPFAGDGIATNDSVSEINQIGSKGVPPPADSCAQSPKTHWKTWHPLYIAVKARKRSIRWEGSGINPPSESNDPDLKRATTDLALALLASASPT